MRIGFVSIGSTFKPITASDRGKLFLVVRCMLGAKAQTVIGYHSCVRTLSNRKQPSDLILLGKDMRQPWVGNVRCEYTFIYYCKTPLCNSPHGVVFTVGDFSIKSKIPWGSQKISWGSNCKKPWGSNFSKI